MKVKSLEWRALEWRSNHWSLRNMVATFKELSPNTCCRWSSKILLVKLLSGECHHWWLVNISSGIGLMSSATLRANVDLALCHHMVSPGHNELMYDTLNTTENFPCWSNWSDVWWHDYFFLQSNHSRRHIARLWRKHIGGLVPKRRYSSALALQLRLSCTNPSICGIYIECKLWTQFLARQIIMYITTCVGWLLVQILFCCCYFYITTS